MKIPLWLIALLFAGYTVWCANFWHNYCKSRCCGDTPALTATTGVPLFNWNGERPVADANFPSWKKSLLAKGGQGDTLVITGYYREGEANGEKLALARAQALKSMMMPEFPDSRIRLMTKMTPADGLAEGTAPKESAGFTWSKMVLKADQGAIIEDDNAITILFPSNSTDRDRNMDVEAYLKKLVEKHKATTNTFSVVGFTDDVGEADANQKLGLGRAKTIGQFLSKNGIASTRITVDSKGEADPVADNSTEDGRHQNRRVVITVNR
jgi:outer membrane protein OmpA-like peptidoglycan-associated protein